MQKGLELSGPKSIRFGYLFGAKFGSIFGMSFAGTSGELIFQNGELILYYITLRGLRHAQSGTWSRWGGVSRSAPRIWGGGGQDQGGVKLHYAPGRPRSSGDTMGTCDRAAKKLIPNSFPWF